MLAATLVAAGFGGGVALGHHLSGTSPAPLLAPTGAAPDGAAAGRAIALVVGRTRPSDGVTFDQWYRARLARLVPGLRIEYQAQLSGGNGCGEWRVFATVPPGPLSASADALVQFNLYSALASVAESNGKVVGLNQHTAAGHTTETSTGCAVQPATGQGTWLDAFDGGAAP